MIIDDLPPLPTPAVGEAFTADQMHEYGALAVRNADDRMRRAFTWAISEDAGLSSIAMAAKLAGVVCDEPDFHPLDRGDFAKCLSLFEAVPEWKGRLSELAELSPHWAEIVASWGDLESAFEQSPDRSRWLFSQMFIDIELRVRASRGDAA